MVKSNVELYEALKRGNVGEEAARMIAESFVPASEVATKTDIAAVKTDVLAVKTDLQHEIEGLRAYMDQRFSQLEAAFMRWTLAFFVPLWVTILAAIVAIVLKA